MQTPLDGRLNWHYHDEIYFFIMGGNLEIKQIEPMSCEAFANELESKGWTPELLGKRWGVTKRRIQQIIADSDRPRYYDDAVKSLPILIKK